MGVYLMVQHKAFFSSTSGYDSMLHFRSIAVRGFITVAACAALVTPLSAQAQNCPVGKPGLLPLKYSGGATVAQITACDLMTRLYIFADDSMMGRQVGTQYHLMGAAYIERELRKLGLQPGGKNGSYYQDFPLWKRSESMNSTITVAGKTLKLGTDFMAVPSGRDPSNSGIAVVYGGIVSDTLTSLDSAAVAGKLLLIRPITTPMSAADRQAMLASTSYKNYLRASAGAAGTIQIQGDSIAGTLVKAWTTPGSPSMDLPQTGRYTTMLVTNAAAATIMGAPIADLKKGSTSAPINIKMIYDQVPSTPGRNVVAILPGSDPKLKGQYIAIGAHNDHVGFGAMTTMREHDSLRIFNMVGRPAGAEGGRTTPITPEEWTKINADIAELRKVYPPRPDSIANGADDDGSGSVSVLEIAEAFAKGTAKPKRSIIFVWHAGEEMGMWGSGYFMDNPTVPRDSIVAQLNIDMVGRGEATDVTGQAKAPEGKNVGEVLHGGPNYVQLVGSRRLSTELGDLVEKVNKDKKHGFVFDYNIDADGHQQNIYCRSDHWSYGKWGVPVVFFTTGGHADYHQVTDEPQYIQYGHMARIDNLIFDIALAAANLDHRVVVDHPKPNPAPATSCKQ